VLVEQENFAPILYVMKYGDFDAVLELQTGSLFHAETQS